MCMENIICPNCGAQITDGLCEYCGSVIQKQQVTASPKQNDAESFVQTIAKYQKVEPFIGGVAVVSIGKQHGAINEQGDIVVPLSSSYVYNYDGRILVAPNRIIDSQGDVIVEAKSIHYLGNSEYLVQRADGRDEIMNENNEFFTIHLPKDVRISLSNSSLGYGCYIVDDDKNKGHGIALKNKLLLPCYYETENLFRYGKFYHENRNLLKIKENWKGTYYSHGIFDLEKRLIVLPCQYLFDTHDSHKYKDRLLVIQNEKGCYGVFDVDSQKLVIRPEYKQVIILDNRVCEVTKKGLFGSKTTTIQL